MPDWGRILLGGLGCFLLAWLSLVASIIGGAPLWLADALLIYVALERSGRALVFSLAAGGIGILLAYFLAVGAFVAPALLVATASILHAAFARFLQRRFAPDSARLETAGALARLLLWSALLSPIPGAIVMSGAALTGDSSLSMAQAFISGWTASAVGTAIFLPCILSLARSASTDLKPLLRPWREALLILALVILAAAIARPTSHEFPLLLGLPVVLWSALRLDFRATSLLCAVLALSSMASVALGLLAPNVAYGTIKPAGEQQIYLLAIILPTLFASLLTHEQRAGDEARQAALRALRTVIDAVPMAIVTSARDGKVSLWSRGAERIFGWRRSEAEGAEPPFVAPEDAAQESSLRQRVLAGNEMQNQPARRRDKEGALHDLMINAAPQRAADGAITGIISVMEDVTYRRRLEASREEQRARLAAILDAVADPIITSDETGTIISFSRAAEAMFGYSAAEIVGSNLNMLMPEPDRSRHDAYLRRYRESGVRRIIGTHRQLSARRRDGSTFPAEITIGEAWIEGKRIFVGLVRDLSGRLSVTTEPAQVQPANAGAAKFLSRITHDLRQPLHALSLMAGALERRIEDAESREIVEDLFRLVRSTQATFENIVEWTRLESGLVGVAPIEIEADDILRSLEQEFAAEAARRNIVFRCVASRARIRCDPALLQRILRQFLDNAMKFAPSGRVLLGARRNGPMLRLIVADTGFGIPANQSDFIFGEYNQLDPGREAGGLGLGLAIARKLAALADLQIGSRSAPARGSLFWVEVPLSTAQP